ncbi:MAG: hypothetical protein GY788_03405 [bacterium]|nr:hypothetical protein [bacterium]
MRQRLLLVAGWAAAAVVASLVSTGAVAVAGGQVTDRPLRPLSAPEVAALAEECGTTERAPCLRQLDNSVVTASTVEAAPDLNSSLNGGEEGVSPPLDDSIVDPPSEDPLDPGAVLDESLFPPEDEAVVPEPRAEVVDLVGGRVSVSGADGVVTVIWAIPKPGFASLPPTGPEVATDSVTVLLSDGSHQSVLVAIWSSQEGLVIETSEGGAGLVDS